MHSFALLTQSLSIVCASCIYCVMIDFVIYVTSKETTHSGYCYITTVYLVTLHVTING